jgi:hypothetical protein
MVLQYIPDGDDPWGIVGQVLESLPPGSYLTVSGVWLLWSERQAASSRLSW